MRRVELAALSEYIRDVRKDPVVVLEGGKPVAAVVPMTADEWENYVVTHHAPLVESTRRSAERFRAEGGSSIEKVMRRFGTRLKAARRTLPRPGRATARRTRGK